MHVSDGDGKGLLAIPPLPSRHRGDGEGPFGDTTFFHHCQARADTSLCVNIRARRMARATVVRDLRRTHGRRVRAGYGRASVTRGVASSRLEGRRVLTPRRLSGESARAATVQKMTFWETLILGDVINHVYLTTVFPSRH